MKERFYDSKKWKAKRDRILMRDSYTCQLCKRYGRMVGAHHVHHIYPYEHYPQFAFENWNLISLCQNCHNRMHDRESHELTAEGLRLQRKVERWKTNQSITKVIPKSRDGMTY
jgi:5-methylcytosine-specific restriction endonuclease McrA